MTDDRAKPSAYSATRLESVEEIRRAASLEAEAPAPPDHPATRLESVEEVRRLMAQERPETPRNATRLESVEEIRQAVAEANATSARPAIVAETFRPKRRPAMAILTVLDDGRDTGETFRLRGDRTVLGREGDVSVSHETMMSTRHAEIVREQVEGRWQWQLVDLDSTNGTYVRLTQATLTHGAIYQLGDTLFRFEDALLNLPREPEENKGPATKTRSWQSYKPTDLKASLVMIEKGGDGPRRFLDAMEYALGREPGAGMIAFPGDSLVDVLHARLTKTPQGTWVITDADSRNGVWRRIDRHSLEGVCEFQLGEQRFRVEIP